MPCPPTVAWDAQAMPWTVPSYSGLMEFTGIRQPDFDPMKTLCSKKRKSLLDGEVPTKQHITEEKMAAHLDGLHISSDYISHRLNSPNTSSTIVTVPFDMQMDPNINTNKECNIAMSAKDLEEKLKNANRITICDEIRRLHTEDAIIPKALLARYEQPCKALVLWQPPQKLADMIVPATQKDDEISEDEEKDNNNAVNSVDLNYCMDVEM
ncbi:uncharacterized protein LOC119660141 isoform X2 [Hermetia illucens]|nr:uncharacterized protein LOC119660141 isoform X2 [Hermetia illucens]